MTSACMNLCCTTVFSLIKIILIVKKNEASVILKIKRFDNIDSLSSSAL